MLLWLKISFLKIPTLLVDRFLYSTKILEMMKRCTVVLMYFNFVSTLRHSLINPFPFLHVFPSTNEQKQGPSPLSTKHSFSSTFYKEGRVQAWIYWRAEGIYRKSPTIFDIVLFSSTLPLPTACIGGLYLLHRENKLRGRKVGEKRKKSVGIL